MLKILFKDIFFSFEASHKGKELAVRSGNEHSKVKPSTNFSEGRLQFGGRDIFTFPPLCPLPLTKGGAFYPAASRRERR